VLGNKHTCALLEGGSVRCWGEAGLAGKLGYGNEVTIGDGELPSSVGTVPIGGTVVQLAAGTDHTCALLDGGNVRCWGEGDDGRLGYGNESDIGDNETPEDAGDVAVGGKVIQLTAGTSHTCALLDNGNVRCWGNNIMGQLGYPGEGTIGVSDTPEDAGDVDVGGKVIQLAAGGNHTCALIEGGDVRCWGTGNSGELGQPGTAAIGMFSAPAASGAIDLGGEAVQLSTHNYHVCAELTGGKVRCWGDGGNGPLGYGNEEDLGDTETPASAGDVDVGATVVEIAAGGQHTCVKLEGSAIRCWGYRLYGVLGYPNLVEDIGDDEPASEAGNVEVF